MPTLARVLRTRDVVFMPSSKDKSDNVYADRQLLREVVTTLDVQDPEDQTDQEIEQLPFSSHQDYDSHETDAEKAEEQLQREMAAQELNKTRRQLLTPEDTPEPPEDSERI